MSDPVRYRLTLRTQDRLFAFIERWLARGCTGSIRINAYKGGVGTVDVHETLKPDDLPEPS